MKKGMGYHADALSQFGELVCNGTRPLFYFILVPIVDQALKSVYMKPCGDFISITSNRNPSKMLMRDLWAAFYDRIKW